MGAGGTGVGGVGEEGSGAGGIVGVGDGGGGEGGIGVGTVDVEAGKRTALRADKNPKMAFTIEAREFMNVTTWCFARMPAGGWRRNPRNKVPDLLIIFETAASAQD